MAETIAAAEDIQASEAKPVSLTDNSKNMTGRVIIVTGANSGIGYEAARYLCEGGNDVILACRNEERGNEAVKKIKAQNPNALANFLQLDVASTESIKKFVEAFHETGKKLHCLVNNAGLAMEFKDTNKQFTEDGYEITMGTNHLGPFLLTHLLLDDLKKVGAEEGGDARIVVVSSSVHDPTKAGKRMGPLRDMDVEDLMYDKEGSYNGFQAYKDSKLANIMFTYQLVQKLEGTGVTVNALNPGFIPTTGLNRSASKAQQFMLKYILGGLLRPIIKPVKTIKFGADAICDVAAGESLKGTTCKYFDDHKEAESSAESKDEDKQKRLWEVSGGLLKMEGFEPIELKKPEEKPVEEEPKKEEDENKTEEPKEEEKQEGEEKKEEGEAEKTKEEQKDEEKPTEDKPSEEKETEKKEEK